MDELSGSVYEETKKSGKKRRKVGRNEENWEERNNDKTDE